MADERDLDIVLWGATGFTGQLTAEQLLRRVGVDGPVRWALGGRNADKLAAVQKGISAQTGVDAGALETVVGDSADDDFLDRLTRRSAVICSTVGPYARYGSGLVEACARNGTHYCDLTGEVHWMQRMIEASQDTAVDSGARVVFTCGFDSIPSDLGTYFLQREMRARHGVPCARVQYRVTGASGGFSGGTIASMMNMLDEAERDPTVARAITEPYSLNPKGEQVGPDKPEGGGVFNDQDFGQWVAPFVMAGINTKIVRRSNALLGYAYGRGFEYDEGVLTGSGPLGFTKAAATASGMVAMNLAMGRGWLRRAVSGRLPQPGDGPSREKQERGNFDIRLRGEHPSDP
ncbi:MAG: saccharopine dehydrogenase NADP-binding domain-containing protein, partial [Acidimicrobiia bacterium]|nr:saccharopine dehydrogenase NADP-binding domain-containing protein [Acidimicrobiia bacterium]